MEVTPLTSTRSAVLALFAAGLSACAHGPRLQLHPPPDRQSQALVTAAQQRLHQQGDPARAEELAREALARAPGLGQAHAVLAHTSRLRGDMHARFGHLLHALADARDRDTPYHLDQIPLDYLGRAQLMSLQRLLVSLADHHPDRQSRAEALGYLVQVQLLLGNTEEARRTVARRTLISSWHGIGGFDNEDGKGFDVPYGPEREIRLDRSYVGSRGKVSWRKVQQVGPEAALELDEFFYPFDHNAAYLVTFVKSTREREVILEVTSSSPVKAWVNDRNVLANREVRRWRHRQFRVAVQLRRGFNKLLIKSCVGQGEWKVGVWFASKRGTPLSLPATPELQPYQRDRRPPLRFDPALVLPARRPMDLRRGLWNTLALAAAGLRPSAIDSIERYLQLNPTDPVALLVAARLHEEEGQRQRASQLLARGQQTKAPHGAAFWIESAGLYRKRGQHDKAFEALTRARTASADSELMVLRRLDQLYHIKGWTLDRCRLARRLREAHGDWVWPASVLASCNHALHRSVEEVAWLQQAVSLAPASEQRRQGLAKTLAERGRCSDAIALQRRTTALRPSRAGPYLQLARTLRACGQLAAAVKTLDRCIERIPNWPTPYQEKGEIFYEQGKTDEAIAQWEISLKHNPDHVKLWDRVTHLRPDRDPVLREFAPSEAQVADVLAQGARTRPVEGSSVIWLLDHEVTRLMPDGTVKRVVTTVRRAVDRAGRDSMGQVRLPRSGLVKVLEAYSVDLKGRRREVTSMHGRTVRYPTLEEGASVVLQYRHIKRPSGYLRHHFASNWLFQHNLEQSARGEWILAIPLERKLHLDIQGDVAHRATSRHGLAVHIFSALNVPPLRPEPRSLPARDLLRTVSVSTVPSWDYFSEWGNSLTAEVFAMDPELKQTLQRITRGKTTTGEKIDAVYHFALTSVRYQQDYETFIAGVKPHTAATVLARGYGDCKDKSVLMIAMLRQLGIKASLALVRTQGAGRVLSKLPSQQFNHAVAYLPPQPGLPGGRFLDATAENLDIDVLRPDDQGTLSLVLFPEGYRLIPVPYQDPERNWFNIDIELELDADGAARAEVVMQAKGVLAGRVRKPLQNHQILRQYAQSVVHKLYPDCSLTDVRIAGEKTILKPLAVRLQATCAGAARSEEGQLRLRVPQILTTASGLAQWTERRHPLFLGPPDVARGSVTVRLPKDATVHSQPQAIKLTHPCAQIEGKWEQLADGRLRYAHRLRRTCAVVAPDAYPAFRAVLNKLKRYLESEVVITPAQPAREARKPPRRAGRARDKAKPPEKKRAAGKPGRKLGK